MEAIRVAATGGPEVLELVEWEEPEPVPGEALVEVSHAGVNFIDTYHRSGLYPLDLPFVPGVEGCGTVTAAGDGADPELVGARVAWVGQIGTYARRLSVPAERLVLVPDAVSSEQAAAVMLQGITAHYLVNDTYRLEAGKRCLVHAGAGGVGRLLIQMAREKGAEVFATAGGPEKCEVARRAGADHAIDYRSVDFGDAIEQIAGDRPLDVVYDGVGRATFDRGLELLRRRGTMVAYGNASGAVPPVDPLRLLRNGSLYLTRPGIADYTAEPADLQARAADVFAAVAEGRLDVLIGSRFPLVEAAAAHRALEGRETIGKVLLEV